MVRIDSNIALHILQLVRKYEPAGIGYLRLQMKTGVSKKVYEYWIKTLRNCHLLTMAAPLHLTKLSRDAFVIGILPSLIPDRYFFSEEDEEKERTVFKDSFPIGKEEERKRLELASKKAACLLLLLLVQGASGTLYLSPMTNREAKPGDMIIHNKPFHGYNKRGFSISDMVGCWTWLDV